MNWNVSLIKDAIRRMVNVLRANSSLFLRSSRLCGEKLGTPTASGDCGVQQSMEFRVKSLDCPGRADAC